MFPNSRETCKPRATIRSTQGLDTYIVMSVASVGVTVAVTVVFVFVVSFVDYSVLTGARAWWSCLLRCLLLLSRNTARHANRSEIPVAILSVLVSSAV